MPLSNAGRRRPAHNGEYGGHGDAGRSLLSDQIPVGGASAPRESRTTPSTCRGAETPRPQGQTGYFGAVVDVNALSTQPLLPSGRVTKYHFASWAWTASGVPRATLATAFDCASGFS